MLDQKLIRENPTLVEENLSLRGKVYKISHIIFLLRINTLQQMLDFLLLIFDLTLFFFYTLIKIVNIKSLFGIFGEKLTKLMIPNLCNIFKIKF